MINKERIPCPQEEKRCCSYKISKLEMAWHRLWFELLRQKGFVNNIIDIVNPHFFLEILYISDICMYYVYWITYILDHGGQIASPVLWSANLLPLLLLLLFLLLLLLLLLLLISQPPSTTTTSTISPSNYYYFHSYWSANLPRLLLLQLFLLLFLLLLQLILSPDRPTIPPITSTELPSIVSLHRALYIVSSFHYVMPPLHCIEPLQHHLSLPLTAGS